MGLPGLKDVARMEFLSQLASTGITGTLGAIGIWAAWSVYKREVTRNDRLEEELRTVRCKIEDKLLPALLEASRRSKEITELLKREKTYSVNGKQ